MRRRFRNPLSAWRERDIGVTLVTVDRWTLAEELWSFGEDATHAAALEMSDEEMVRLWILAGRLYWRGDASSAGEAGALAAVSIIEGEERPLARKRRRPQRERPTFRQTPEQRLAEIARIEESESFPASWR